MAENVWIVRWRKSHEVNKHVYDTQATRFRVFDSHDAAQAFRDELRRRIALRYEADYGREEEMYMFSTCRGGDTAEPGGYDVDRKNGVTVELVCAEMNDSKIAQWEVAIT